MRRAGAACSQSNPNKMEQTDTPKSVNRIMAILTIDTENLPSNFQEIIKHEQEVIAQWKIENLIEHLFLRQTIPRVVKFSAWKIIRHVENLAA